jgi:hypothetical protein
MSRPRASPGRDARRGRAGDRSLLCAGEELHARTDSLPKSEWTLPLARKERSKDLSPQTDLRETARKPSKYSAPVTKARRFHSEFLAAEATTDCVEPESSPAPEAILPLSSAVSVGTSAFTLGRMCHLCVKFWHPLTPCPSPPRGRGEKCSLWVRAPSQSSERIAVQNQHFRAARLRLLSPWIRPIAPVVVSEASLRVSVIYAVPIGIWSGRSRYAPEKTSPLWIGNVSSTAFFSPGLVSPARSIK